MSTEAEINFVSCLLSNPEMSIQYDIKADDFINPQYGLIFSALMDMIATGEKVTEATFFDYWRHKNPSNTNEPALLEILAGFSQVESMDTFAAAVIRDSRGRQLGNKLIELSEKCFNFGAYEEKLDYVFDQIAELKIPEQKQGTTRNESLRNIMAEMERRKTIVGIDGLSTGFDNLDKRFNGLKDGDLIIVAGRPSMGKTTFGLNIADHVAIEGKGVLVFSLEMGETQLTDKTISSISGLPLSDIQKGKMEPDQEQIFNDTIVSLTGNNFEIVESARTVKQMMRIAKRKKMRQGLDLIVIDYIQQMNAEGKNRTEQISNISRGLKQMARELDVPVIALSQLNRGVESRQNKRPSASDLKESGAIEEDADIIMFVYRDEFYYPNCHTNKNYAEIITAKFRNGEVGSNLLQTELHKSRFKFSPAKGYKPYENKNFKD